MAFAPPAHESSPMGDLNTTPLIDVMLVLLVMFIITIPVASHTVDIDLPVSCQPECPQPLTPDPIKNKIVIDANDNLLWNGTPVSEGQIAALLIETTRFDVEPELQFEPSALASYALAARTLKTIKASQVTKFGFVGNEKHRKFDRGV